MKDSMSDDVRQIITSNEYESSGGINDSRSLHLDAHLESVSATERSRKSKSNDITVLKGRFDAELVISFLSYVKIGFFLHCENRHWIM